MMMDDTAPMATTSKSQTSTSTSLLPLNNNNPTITLHNGIAMPLLHLGTAHIVLPGQPDPDQAHDTFVGFQPERAYRQVELALRAGMRAFDTAVNYRSDVPLGRVLGEWFRQGNKGNTKIDANDDAPLQRPQVWITTKVMNPRPSDFVLKRVRAVDLHTMTPDQVADQTEYFVEQALTNLSLGYVDLLLLHWPSCAGQGTEQLNRQQRIASWRVLEAAYRRGWCRAIGVSNYSAQHLQQLMQDGAKIVPMVNQIEASVDVQQREIVEYCQKHGIVPQAYSCLRGLVKNPLQQQQQQDSKEEQKPSTAMTVLNSLATKYNKDVGQIVYKYLIQLGYSVVYLTNSQKRMVSNNDLWDFGLSTDDMAVLAKLSETNDGGWGLPKPDDCL